jgi:hypothetical protein
MLKTRNKCGRKPGSRTRFKGIVADAKLLHVSSEHLWRVLIGERQSQSLTTAYHALKASQNQKAA